MIGNNKLTFEPYYIHLPGKNNKEKEKAQQTVLITLETLGPETIEFF